MKKVVFALIATLIVSFNLFGQKIESDLSSPRATVNTHLYYLESSTYDLNKSKTVFNKKVKNAEILAIQLKQVLNGKGLYVDIDKLPTESNYKDSITGKYIYKLFPEKLPTIYVQKEGKYWYYSSETVRTIPALHKKIYPFGADILVNIFPDFGQKTFLNLKIWQWIGGFILIILTAFTYWLITLIIRPILRRLLESRFKKVIPDAELVWKIARLLSVLIAFQLLKRTFPILQLPVNLGQAIGNGIEIVQTVIFIFLLLRIIDLGIHYFRKLTDKTENTLDDQLVPIVRTTLDVIVVIGGIIHVLTLLNVNVTALIAGISIGGLAIALAAQDTVKNLIGSVMIFADKPFQIGDSIKVKDVSGTVEVVGFRSTRIRTLDNSVVSIPNGILANEIVNNLALRIYRKFAMTIGVTYQTSPDNLETFVNGIKLIIEKHPKAKNDGFEVVFSNMSASSLDIMLNGFLDVPTWSEELKTKQEILLAIIRLAEVLNINFAFPSTSVYIEKSDVDKSAKRFNNVEELLKNFEAQFEKSE